MPIMSSKEGIKRNDGIEVKNNFCVILHFFL